MFDTLIYIITLIIFIQIRKNVSAPLIPQYHRNCSAIDCLSLKLVLFTGAWSLSMALPGELLACD